MKTLIATLFCCVGLLLSGCASTHLVEERTQLDRYVGRKIKIIGEVSRTKTPTIMGVEVEASYDLCGTICEAEGVLVRWVVTEKNLKPWMQSRGAGVFYRLRKPFSNETVHAKPLNQPLQRNASTEVRFEFSVASSAWLTRDR
ncbi:MAG: hypothetical protein QM760_05880 [Nibricoccus sp.]